VEEAPKVALPFAQFGMHARGAWSGQMSACEQLSHEHGLVGVKGCNVPSSISSVSIVQRVYCVPASRDVHRSTGPFGSEKLS
jgi:hypothetical protein